MKTQPLVDGVVTNWPVVDVWDHRVVVRGSITQLPLDEALAIIHEDAWIQFDEILARHPELKESLNIVVGLWGDYPSKSRPIQQDGLGAVQIGPDMWRCVHWDDGSVRWIPAVTQHIGGELP